MSQVLYHFTAVHNLEHIRAEGLTKGALPWNLHPITKKPTFARPFQWLTTNPDYLQPWCLLGNLPYARNAVRITVCVPSEHEHHVYSWMEMCRRCNPDSAAEINATGGDVDNWRIFHGKIPPSWFLAIDRNMNERLSSLLVNGEGQ